MDDMKKREIQRYLAANGFWVSDKPGGRHELWTDGTSTIPLHRGDTIKSFAQGSIKSQVRRALASRGSAVARA